MKFFIEHINPNINFIFYYYYYLFIYIQFAQALALLITRHPSLTALDVAGDGKQFLMGADILPLIESLAGNNKLRELNISHNKIGDRCAIALSEALRKNACLQRLKWVRGEKKNEERNRAV